jgi:hypothetical protein
MKLGRRGLAEIKERRREKSSISSSVCHRLIHKWQYEIPRFEKSRS